MLDIYHCKKPKDPTNPEASKLELSHHRSEDGGQPRSYEYYVNYLQLERRNNRWISEEMIDANPDLISKALDKFEKNMKLEESQG